MVVGVGPEDLDVREFLSKLISVIGRADEVGAALDDIGVGDDFVDVFYDVVLREETVVDNVVGFDYDWHWIKIFIGFEGGEVIVHQSVFKVVDEVSGLLLLLFGAV